MKKKCFDPECAEPATKKLRGYRMCVGHFIEALEHGAHLGFGQWDGKDEKIWNQQTGKTQIGRKTKREESCQ